ncbi:protein RISC-INTERACTING CLEARING 3'-5' EXORIBONUCLEASE 2-like [Cornus florida]|uniref:protein RISC-INTERACTING CLEARING 3'-5' EXORIBONUCLEASE 2-like n=1 Tax=Cornus florida TaxID=4283 RepID=UPI0028A129B7|nr:protein RISC-INTERACTING CLEARING 3'-5' EXORIBONUCLEASE 2-like [Cornus florida]
MTKIEIGDGNIMEMSRISSEDELESCLGLLWDCLIAEGSQKMVGFDLQWRPKGDVKGFLTPELLHLLLCTDVTCFVVHSRFLSNANLKKFLAQKEITFVGIHIAKDLAKLEHDYGIVFRNVVDISKHAANVLRRPRLRAGSVSELAYEVINLKLNEKPIGAVYDPFFPFGSGKTMEYAAIDAYASFKIGKKLHGRPIQRVQLFILTTVIFIWFMLLVLLCFSLASF